MASRDDLIARLKPFIGEDNARQVVEELEGTAYDAAAEGATKATVSIGKPIMYVSLGAAIVSLAALWKSTRRRQPAMAGVRPRRRRRRHYPAFRRRW
jgi:hypothetical protein